MAMRPNDQSKQEFTCTTSNFLRSWTPATTRLIAGQQNCFLQTSFDILDYCFPSNFAEALIAEIQNNSLWRDELRPAKTTGDIQLSNLMTSFLATTTTETNIVGQAPHNSVRGDSSMFIPRHYRRQQDFHTTNPHVSHLISSVQKTVQHSLEPYIDFDMSQTSVQLATYPGDGCSGYLRHCDRGQDHCNHETSINVQQDNSKGRIVTAIYYLTPSDWSEELDGGCLRLFCDGQNEKGDGFYDVVPYQNRLVVFRSDSVEHEVLPSLRRERMALTIWFYGSVNTSSSIVTTNAHEYRIPPVLSLSSSSIPESGMENTSISKQESDGQSPLSIDVDNVELLNHCKNAKIFVSIAAYRDTELGPTLKSLMDNAQSSQRIFAGVVLQIDTSPTTGTKTPTTPLAENHVDAKIWETLPSDQPWFHKQVRIITMDAKHAQGPCYARYLCQTLWRDEEYVLQIDSHMRFRRNWDTYLIHQLMSIDAKVIDGGDGGKTTNVHSTTYSRTMLTAYPVGYTLPNTIPNETRGTLLVPWKFDKNGMLRQKGRLLESPRTSKDGASVIPCYLYAAGFNFARYHVIKDCPYDVDLRHLFFGEEMSMAVRLYCKGYDLYAPTESVVYHLWSRSHRPTVSSLQPLPKEEEEQKMKQKKASHEKVLRQLGGSEDSVRTASQFATVLGVNFDNQTIQPGAELGGLSAEEFASDNSLLGVATTARTTSLPGRANNPTAKAVPTLDTRAQNLISAFLGNM